MNLSEEMLEAVLYELEKKNEPLTVVGAGKFPKKQVDAFVKLCKADGRKQITDCCASFCYGRAHTKRCIWTREFQEMVLNHFESENYAEMFTPMGKRGQSVAIAMQRCKARASELRKNAGKAARDIAMLVQRVCKKVDLHGAKIEAVEDGAFRVSLTATRNKITKTHVFTVDANGVQKLLETGQPEYELGRERSNVPLE